MEIKNKISGGIQMPTSYRYSFFLYIYLSIVSCIIIILKIENGRGEIEWDKKKQKCWTFYTAKVTVNAQL